MADIYIKHVEDVLVENPDPEIEAELEELITAREQVEAIYIGAVQEQNREDSVPFAITAFLQNYYPEVFPITLTLFNEKPVQYLLATEMPITRAASYELDALWSGVIVLEQLPVA